MNLNSIVAATNPVQAVIEPLPSSSFCEVRSKTFLQVTRDPHIPDWSTSNTEEVEIRVQFGSPNECGEALP